MSLANPRPLRERSMATVSAPLAPHRAHDEKIHIAPLIRCSSGLRTKQNNPLRIKSIHQPPRSPRKCSLANHSASPFSPGPLPYSLQRISATIPADARGGTAGGDPAVLFCQGMVLLNAGGDEWDIVGHRGR